jgi:hypothetical protein
MPCLPEPLVIKMRTRRGGSGHTSIQPHFGELNISTLFVIGLNLCGSFLLVNRQLTPITRGSGTQGSKIRVQKI